MCGILGFLSKSTAISDYQFITALKSIKHRGPDNEGVWHNDDNKVFLGHNRLAIIDLTINSNQPFKDPTSNYIIVFNGEIYNYIEIREVLKKSGISFKTKCDTEVILESYKMWGNDCIERLNGMFSFAILDRKKNLLFCARDRAGEKPFFYSLKNNNFIFCSEIKGILNLSIEDYTLNLSSLNCFLNEGYVSGSKSILNDIHKLESAHAMILDITNFEIKKWRYWNLPILNTNNNDSSESKILFEVENLLTESISQQLIADVPVGILLSGGIDSSIITALAAKSKNNISTFTVSFPGNPKYDESKHAKLVSNYFGTNHRELIADPTSIDLLPILAEQFDEPIIDSSIIPTYLVTKLIKNYCTVALGGDGGDELFGGYGHYSNFFKLNNNVKNIPLFLRKYPSNLLYNILPHGFKSRKWIRAIGQNLNNDLPLVANYFDENERFKLLGSFLNDDIKFAEQHRQSRIYKHKNIIERSTRTDFLNYLTEDILVKVDRSSMLNSLEIRAPFLDYRIIEYAYQQIPTNLKVNANNKKVILQKLATKILPTDFQINRKQGFSIPLNSWIKQKEWQSFFSDVLLSSSQNIFNHKFIEKGLNNLKNDSKNLYNPEPMFGLLMFELWRSKYKIKI
jgi:asparagine synthase (glutamine-hydrolysing)